ncbi:MAG: hypothetical protein ABSD20_09735 [Terriglobales bacterium]|jgi:hypothetical protein
MAQITIYLPATLENRARKTAKLRGLSVSRWIADQIVHNLDDAWPKGVLAAAGAIPDFPDLKDLRQGYGKDSRREPI